MDYYEEHLQSSRYQKEDNTEFNPKISKAAESGSGKTTSYQANCLVLGYQDRLFPEQQSRPDSQDCEEEQNQVLGNSRFHPESSPPISATENSFQVMQNNFINKIVTSKLTSGLSTVRMGTLDFDQSSQGGNQPQQKVRIQT